LSIPDEKSLTFKVTAETEGMRLDAFLVLCCPEFSRTRIQEDLRCGLVLVNKTKRPKGYRLRPDSTVEYTPQSLAEMVAIAQDLPLEIIYQDDDILVVNKAVGMVVHPAVGHPDGTLVNALLHHVKGLTAGDDPLRPGIVHRLDRDTSGLLVVALNDRAHRHLGDQLRDRRMGRTYEALSWGTWKEDKGTITGDIGRHPKFRQKKAIVPDGGRHAVTHYEVLENFGFVQFCRIELETGRTHQIRVHFSSNHHPVVGDGMYGDDRRARGVHPLDRMSAAQMVRDAGRQLLHAAELHLEHPVTGEELVFSSEMPSDMAHVLKSLRESQA
jgi:23S rRNA pseudouridine1911/1915/1917 synthase